MSNVLDHFHCPSCATRVTVPTEPNNPDVGDYDVTIECHVCQDVWTMTGDGMVLDADGTERTTHCNCDDFGA